MSLAAELAARRPRILVLDIERIHGLAPIFDQRTSGFIPVSKWSRLPALLCFAAKHVGDKKVEFHASWDDHEAMVRRSWELYDQADIVITFNGVRFDNPHLRGAWLLAGLTPPRPWKDVDLYRVGKSAFKFESASLNHLCKVLGLPMKSGHWSAEAAEACVEGDAKAQKSMQKYNEGDVRITEAVYHRLLPYIPNHPHVGLYTGEERSCANCGSTKLKKAGRYVATTISYAQFVCKDCGAYSRMNHHLAHATTRSVR